MIGVAEVQRPQAAAIHVAEVAELVSIFEPDVNLCVWSGALAPQAAAEAAAVAASPSCVIEAVSSGALDRLSGGLNHPALAGRDALCGELAFLVEVFADLCGAEQVGLRLVSLEDAMCRRFHVDHVGLRLICTLHGAGTEWLAEADCDRRWLGAPMEQGGRDPVARPGARIERLVAGEVGLFKGTAGPGMQHRAIVHRSPPVSKGERRLLLTLDAVG